MQVEPGGRSVPELARDNGRIKGGQLIEADHGRDLEAGAGAGRDRRRVRPRAGHGGDEAHHQIGAAQVVARDDEGRTALVAGQVGEREAGKDDAAKGEHLAGLRLHQVGVGVEVGFVGEPVEGTAGLGDGRHGQGVGPAVHDFHQHMHAGLGSDSMAD